MGTRKFFILIIFCFMLSGLTVVFSSETKNLTNSIVKIYTVYNKYDFYDVGEMMGMASSTGSGCIISGNRILTAAHIVDDQTFIQVKKAGTAKKYTAEVEAVAHECDLAILKVKDKEFFKDTVSLDIGELANIRDNVTTYGFPTGGEKLSLTVGVVSRIEHKQYSHSKAVLLCCQTDAAINSGSSGGPVIKDGRVIGVAFQAKVTGQNIGYMVPAPIIKHFLLDIKDGRYDGFPYLGMQYQFLENPDLRAMYGMSKKQTGVLINKIMLTSPLNNIIQEKDIILSIDNIMIENDGTIEFRSRERTNFALLFQKKQIGEEIFIQILRNKKLKKVKVKLTTSSSFGRLVPHTLYETPPTYYIKAGLVFVPLTRNLLKRFGAAWYNDAPRNLVEYYYSGWPKKEKEQVVVLLKIFADQINIGYHDYDYEVIKSINDKKISNIHDVVNAFETCKEKYYRIETEDKVKIVLDRKKADKASAKILKTYKITRDRSIDLKRVKK